MGTAVLCSFCAPRVLAEQLSMADWLHQLTRTCRTPPRTPRNVQAHAPRKHKDKIDSLAAVVILREWLESVQ